MVSKVPPSPKMNNRNSLPPLFSSSSHLHNHTYTASPLQRALTPPRADAHDLPPFPSVESSIDSAKSGANFHMSGHGLSDSSPSFAGSSHRPQSSVEIYCAGCRRLTYLLQSLGCCDCMGGFCKDCVEALLSEQSRRRAVGCPKCGVIGGKYKPFQFDLR